MTYLYNTLHYYERHLRDRTNLKRKLVHAIMSSLKDNRTPGWCLSETYLKFGMNPREDNIWVPDDTYYCKLIGRLVDNILPCVSQYSQRLYLTVPSPTEQWMSSESQLVFILFYINTSLAFKSNFKQTNVRRIDGQGLDRQMIKHADRPKDFKKDS